MKIRFFAFLMLASLFITSCGKDSVEKGTLKGRTASIIEYNKNIIVFAKADVDEIINKSGIFDGSIPEQYAAFIKVYKESIFNALDMDQPIHILLEGPVKNNMPQSVYLLFEVKDFAKLKKELTDLGGESKEKDGISFFSQDYMAVGVKEKFGVLRIAPNKATSFDEMKAIIASSEHDVKNEKLAEILNSEDDISVGMELGRFADFASSMDKNTKESLKEYKKDMVGSYIKLGVNLETGKATMKMDFLFEKAMDKYKPFNESAVSSEALHSLGGGSPIFALATNLNYEKLFDLFYNSLPQDQRAEIDNTLAMVGGKEKVSKMFTGEVAFAVGEVDPNTFTSKISAYAGLNDASYLKSLVSGFAGFAGLSPQKDDLYSSEAMDLKLTDKKVVFTTNKSSFADAVVGKSPEITAPEGFKFGNSPFSGFVDFNKLDTNDFDVHVKAVLRAMKYATVEGDNKGITVVLKSKAGKENILREIVTILVTSITNEMINPTATPETDSVTYDIH